MLRTQAPAGPLLDDTVGPTLRLVADTIVASLGFGVAVVNLLDEARGEVLVAAVSGPDDVVAELLGRRDPRAAWDTLLAHGESWGDLLFLDHRRHDLVASDVFSWVPDLEVVDDPDAWHPLDALFAPLRTGDGRLLGVLAVDVPVDGRRPGPAACRAVEALAVTAALALEHAQLVSSSRRDLRRLQAVFGASPLPIALVAPSGCFLDVNAAYSRFLGRPPEELLGREAREFTHPDDVAVGVAPAARAPDAGAGCAPVEKRYLRPDTSVVWGRLHLAPLGSADEPGVVVAMVEDVTERRRVQDQLVAQASVDGLTGLLNRSALMAHLHAVLGASFGSTALTSVLFCDLDKLKLVNDGYGHGVGDEYLCAVADRIRAAAGPAATLGRLGGDEFVVVAPVPTPTDAVGLAGRVIAAVHRPLDLGPTRFTPSVSVGIALASGGSHSADEVLAQADAAMYAAKSSSPGSWRLYDPSSRNSAVEHLQLRAGLERALARHELRLHYQPIVRLSDQRVVGREALLRGQHPERGLLGPSQFLDVVLGSEYETLVTDWALEQACQDAGAGGWRVSVNVSSVQIGRRDLPERTERAMHAHGLRPGDLVLELTEDRLLARADGDRLLEDLRAAGARLALDDFGSGWAGLDYLQRFPSLDIVKLDRSFTADLGRKPMSEHILTSVVGLMRDSGLALIVEGVETGQQAQRLRELDVTLAQGFLFGRPEPLHGSGATGCT
ncbi:MAG: diguanylate cyclase/phosphodiesterase with sensor [Frankiales bacterium]|nr:diguanylate cyclase/phosphodiesterase with sensor [Frankiales bacterium]